MSKIYNKLEYNFTQIPNKILTDKRLSSVAFKLYSYIAYRLSNNKKWKLYNKDIMKYFKEGRRAFDKAKKELIEFDYLKKINQLRENGRYGACDYEIYSEPIYHIQTTQNGASVNSNTVNNHINNNINNKQTNNKEYIKEKEQKFIKPTLEEIESYSTERNSNVDCKKFFDYYELSDWKDKNDIQIKNWRHKFITWEGRYQNNTSKNSLGRQNNTNKVINYNYNFNGKNFLDSIIGDDI